MNDNGEVNTELSEEVKTSKVWKLADFTATLNEQFQEKYDEELNITFNTVNNHFRKLESGKIHFLNRMNGVKIYDQLDLSIAMFISFKRSKKQQKGNVWQLPQIYDEISRVFECRTEDQVDLLGSYNENSETVKLFEELQDKIISLVKDMNAKKQEQMLLALNSTKQDVETRIGNSILDLMNLQRTYKKQAVELWEQKPKAERFNGLIFKTENISKREKFIDDYINDKLLSNYSSMIEETEE